MCTLRISLFGQLRILDESQRLIELEARRAQELFCYLLLHRQRLHLREQLATLLWCDKSASQSKRYLRQTLWQVQSTLNHHATPAEQLLVADYDRIGINSGAIYWLDLAVFEQAYVAVEKIPGRELTTQQVELLRRTVRLYQGDLLEGWYHDWCIYERERRQSMYLSMLDKLLTYSEVHGDYESALACGAQILGYDRAREQTHRQLMRLHSLVGNRTAAIHQYEACVTALREELNVGPAKSTLALYKQICTEQLSPTPLAVDSEARCPTSPTPATVDPLRQLAEIQATLTGLQAQVAQVLSALSHDARPK